MPRESAFRYRSFLPIAFGVSVLLGSMAGDHGLPGLVKARADERRLMADLAALRSENAALLDRARRLQTDGSAIEAIARRDFGLARPDELVVTVQPATSSH